MALIGAFSEIKDAIEETQKICDEVKPKAEVKTGKKYKEFVAVNYSSQIVNGTNFLIKVHVGGDSYIFLKVFQTFNGAVELMGVQEDRTKDDPLIPF